MNSYKLEVIAWFIPSASSRDTHRSRLTEFPLSIIEGVRVFRGSLLETSSSFDRALTSPRLATRSFLNGRGSPPNLRAWILSRSAGLRGHAVEKAKHCVFYVPMSTPPGCKMHVAAVGIVVRLLEPPRKRFTNTKNLQIDSQNRRQKI